MLDHRILGATVVDGEGTGALTGTVLRSGRDTDTVTVH
jgi:hypothetical protein